MIQKIHSKFTGLFLLQAMLITIITIQLSAQTLSKANGFRGIWYMNQPSNDEYVFKYSGGLGTYCAKHKPLAIYASEVDKTFFCFGGTTEGSYLDSMMLSKGIAKATYDKEGFLLHNISYFDHRTKMVANPTILLDKKTLDAHDNPVISIDNSGYIWIFSTSHGTMRPSYIHKSTKPYDIDAFEKINPIINWGDTVKKLDNFSYMQPWYVGKNGFNAFFTVYDNPAKRTLFFMSSKDGVSWFSTRLAAVDEGHYQITAANKKKSGTAFNYHPNGRGLNWRTNLYYIESEDGGKSWQNISKNKVEVPLTKPVNAALVKDYESAGLNVYLKDIVYDNNNYPIILFITSKGYKSGPENNPRTWTIARWDGKLWLIHEAFTSDNNYDMGSIYIEDDQWRIICPSEAGPQKFNPGGEVALWVSDDRGASWKKSNQLTNNSSRNHTYVRRPVQAHPDFYGFWADGHGRKPSKSNLYFTTNQGETFKLPEQMNDKMGKPFQVFR